VLRRQVLDFTHQGVLIERDHIMLEEAVHAQESCNRQVILEGCFDGDRAAGNV
jgi:hypothetical protein